MSLMSMITGGTRSPEPLRNTQTKEEDGVRLAKRLRSVSIPGFGMGMSPLSKDTVSIRFGSLRSGKKPGHGNPKTTDLPYKGLARSARISVDPDPMDIDEPEGGAANGASDSPASPPIHAVGLSESAQPIDAAELQQLMEQPNVKAALAADPDFRNALQAAREKTQQAFQQVMDPLASDPAWLAIITGRKDVSDADLQNHLEAVDEKLVAHLKNAADVLTQAHLAKVKQVMGRRRSIAQLSELEKLQRAKLETLFHSQLAHLQLLADNRMQMFQQTQMNVMRHLKESGELPDAAAPHHAADSDGDASDKDVAAAMFGNPLVRSGRAHRTSPEEQAQLQAILNDPTFQQEEKTYRTVFEEGLKTAILSVISHPDWMKSLTHDTAADRKAQADKLNQAIHTYMQQTAHALAAHFKTKSAEVLGQDKALRETPFEALPPEKKLALLRLQLQMQTRQDFLKDYDAQGFFSKVHQEFAMGTQTKDDNTLKARLAGLQRAAGKEFSLLIQRCKSADAEIRALGFTQLLSVLTNAPKPGSERLLRHAIRAVAAVPVVGNALIDEEDAPDALTETMGMKMQAAGAIMRLPEDRDKKQLLLEWLTSNRLENRVAVLKLFGFAQGPGAGATAYRLVAQYPELRAAIEALRKSSAVPVQEALGLLDRFFASQDARQRRATDNRTRDRLFSAPKL
jgi:hypothetical protein